MARSNPTPRAIRYHANGANPARRTRLRNGLMMSSEEKNAVGEANGNFGAPRRRQLIVHLEELMRECGRHRGDRDEKRKLGRGRPVQSHRKASDNGRARPRHARNQREHLAQPDAERARERRLLGGDNDGGRTEPLDEQHDEPADDECAGKYAWAFIQNRLYEVGEEGAGEKGRDRGNDHRRSKMTRLRAGADLRGRADQSRAIDPDDCEDRPELDHHREDAAGIVEANRFGDEQQVRGRGDRKELRDSLHDSEQRRN